MIPIKRPALTWKQICECSAINKIESCVEAALNAIFEVDLSVKSLFEAPTIKAIIQVIDDVGGRLDMIQDGELKTNLCFLAI